jgi:hypothetical protein
MEFKLRTCRACEKILRGRTDKKFCNDHCRNTYNNRLRAPETALIRNITLVIRRNRAILKSVLGEKKNTSVDRNELIEQGFRFQYHTHLENQSKGNDVVCCYDVGYMPAEKDKVVVVRVNRSY